MVRRLSITVPDELWDSLSHLEQSPPALVQRSLRCLRKSEGINRQMTPLEAAAADIPEWKDAIDELTEQATELRAEGYEAVMTTIHDGQLGISWLEIVCENYSIATLPRALSRAADQYLRCLNLATETADQTPTAEQILKHANSEWVEEHRSLLFGLTQIIQHQVDGDLKRIGLKNFQLGPSSEPSTRIPLSLFDGMAHSIFDIVSTVRTRVLEENSPRTLGSYKI